MKKIIAITLSILTVFALSSCSKKAEEEVTATENNTTASITEKETEATSLNNKTQTLDLNKIKEEIKTKLNKTDAMDMQSESLTDLYGISVSDIKSQASFVVASGTFPEEVIMIEAADKSKIENITDCLNARLDDVKVQSESYDAENYAIAQKCKVITYGNYVALFVSASHEKMENIFYSYTK